MPPLDRFQAGQAGPAGIPEGPGPLAALFANSGLVPPAGDAIFGRADLGAGGPAPAAVAPDAEGKIKFDKLFGLLSAVKPAQQPTIGPQRPPAPVAPRLGGQNLDPNIIANIFQILGGAGAGGAGQGIPSLGSLINPTA